MRGMAAMGFLGYNVTTPCKTFRSALFLDEVSEAAETKGAVNTRRRPKMDAPLATTPMALHSCAI